MAKNQYKYGRAKEKKLAQLLRSRGASVKVSKDSKGSADLRVRFSTGTKWVIQVKSGRGSTISSPSPEDIGRLNKVARKNSATPVVAKVSPKGIEYISARSNRKLTPPKSKK